MLLCIAASVRVTALLCTAATTVSCQGLLGEASSGASAAEELAAMCAALNETYVPPQGSGSGTPQKTHIVLQQLGLPAHAGRVNAARRILEHSECYESGILLGAIAITSGAGDPRPLRDLEEIATGVGYEGRCRGTDEEEPPPDDGNGNGNGDGQGHGQDPADHDPSGERGTSVGSSPTQINYATLVRISASSAIGRVVERPRNPAGQETEPVELDRVHEARIALTLVAACAQEPSDLRAAATESLGLIRQPATTPVLDLLAADPGDPNTTTAAIIRLSAERSLTTTLVNNHSANSPTARELADLLEASQQGGEP